MSRIVCLTLVILLGSLNSIGNSFLNDTIGEEQRLKDPSLFYDSLDVKAHRHKFTGWVYDQLMRGQKEWDDQEVRSYEYYCSFEGKTIAAIRIKSLDVFGPDFNDTTKIPQTWLEKSANKLHTKSNLNVIKKNLWFEEGELLDANLIMDNERLLRSLPYIKDVKFVITPRESNPELLDILIITKDVFSFGISGDINEIESGSLWIYNKNIFGVGHQVSLKAVGHMNREPNIGFETYYTINNLGGNFVDFTIGYANTYKREGFALSLDKEFLKPSTKWAGSINAERFFRSDRISYYDPIRISYSLDFKSLDVWLGRQLKLGINENDSRFQMTFAARVRLRDFYDRPPIDDNNHQYFSDSKLYLASLSFSQRRYIRDYLIYSYGITEDIPKGYLHEIVFGCDDNEYSKRLYSHLYLSTGNIVKYKPYYLFASFGAGGYFKSGKPEQGLIEFNADYISRLFNAGTKKARQFLTLEYMIGVRRFDIENLYIRDNDGIRGFSSYSPKGQQRLNFKIESVFFHNRSILNFNTALFTFLDLGIIGSNQKIIFSQDYYTGIGIGLRLRNESLVFRTIQLRLSFYPNHPDDMGFIGFILDERSKSSFNSFQPRIPDPLLFK